MTDTGYKVGDGLWKSMKKSGNKVILDTNNDRWRWTLAYNDNDDLCRKYTNQNDINNLKQTEQMASIKKAKSEYSDIMQAFINQGAVEIAQLNGTRLLKHPNGYIYNEDGGLMYSYRDHAIGIQSRNMGFTEAIINDPSNNIFEQFGSYMVEKSKYNNTKKLNIKEFKVVVDLDTKEIISGKEQLDEFGLLTQVNYHLNTKEEAIFNIQEIANHYATLECNKSICDFSLEKHPEEFKKVYERQLNTLLTFKLSENE